MRGFWVGSALVLALALGGCEGTEAPPAPELATQAQAVAPQCGEAQCVPVQGVYISHFTGPGCTGLEHYYTPYFGNDGVRRSWDGQSLAGTELRTVTSVSYKDSTGTCRDAWPSGNTLFGFVRIYRDASSGVVVVTPASASSAPLRQLAFSTSGGTPPYSWAFVANNSGGQLSAQGAYRTGFRGNTTDVLRVTDSAGNSRDVTVTVDRETLFLGALYHATHDPAVDEAQLRQMITELGGGQVHQVGTNYDVHLLVQTEWIWGLSHPQGQAPDFSRFKAFADTAQRLGLAHTVLLNYHDVPGWVEGAIVQRYGKNPRVINSLGQSDTCSERTDIDCPVGNFMRFSPSSPAYADYAVPWTRAAMQALTPYLGVSVNTVFCGNEMAYDLPTLSSYDAFTLEAWRAYTGNPSAALPLSSTRQWQEFRSRELKKMFKLLLDTARASATKPVLLSTKLVPYLFGSTFQLRSGVYPGVFELMDDASMDFVGADMYPPTAAEYQFAYRRDKPLYLAEFNTAEQPGVPPATREQVREWLKEGIQHYGLRWATFYQWSANGSHYAMTPEQKQGLRDVAAWVTALPRLPSKPRRIRFLYDGAQLSPTPGVSDADSWMLHGGAAERMIGAAQLSYELRTKPAVAYELGTQAVSGTDLPVYEVNGQRGVGTLSGSAVYLLTRTGARVDSSSGSVSTYSGDADSRSYVARPTASFAQGALLFDWTQGWHEGNRTLSTNLGHTLYVRTLAGNPLGIRSGNTFFLGQDSLWSAYRGSGSAPRWPVDRFLKDITGELGY